MTSYPRVARAIIYCCLKTSLRASGASGWTVAEERYRAQRRDGLHRF
ncbi:MAG: hypothetical protein LBV77_03670 [Candidatus Adiutrix intracellularis]|nr:hypothetical protein [Candidatus Adiutrix intracellularis]